MPKIMVTNIMVGLSAASAVLRAVSTSAGLSRSGEMTAQGAGSRHEDAAGMPLPETSATVNASRPSSSTWKS